MMPGTPQLARRKPVLMGVLIGVGIALFVVSGGILYSMRARASDASGSSSAIAAASETAAVPPSDPIPAAVDTQALPVKIAVMVTTEPVDAVVAIDGDREDKPKPQPRMVLVGPDETMSVRVEAKGYKSKTVPVDLAKLGTADPRLVVKLDPIATKPATPAGKPAVAKPATAAPTATGLTCPPGMRPDMWGKSCEKPY